MRRLFSTFAPGAPGAGLLLLRATTAAALFVPAVDSLARRGSALDVAASVFAAVDGLLLALGLWTPLAAGFAALFALVHAAMASNPCTGLLLASMATAIGLVGPGAWSVDARLFGWKRVETAPRNSPQPPSE